MESVKNFTNELASLYESKPPISKKKVVEITKAAMKAIKYYKHVVQNLEKFIIKCKPDYKVPGLYVMDSIVRQSRHQFGADKDVFAPRFAIHLQQTFDALMQCSDDDKRRVVRVFSLWMKNDVFSTEVVTKMLLTAAEQGIDVEPVEKRSHHRHSREPDEAPNHDDSMPFRQPPEPQVAPAQPQFVSNSFVPVQDAVPVPEEPQDVNFVHQIQELTKTLIEQQKASTANETGARKSGGVGKLLRNTGYDYSDDEDEDNADPAANQSTEELMSHPHILEQIQEMQRKHEQQQQQQVAMAQSQSTNAQVDALAQLTVLGQMQQPPPAVPQPQQPQLPPPQQPQLPPPQQMMDFSKPPPGFPPVGFPPPFSAPPAAVPVPPMNNGPQKPPMFTPMTIAPTTTHSPPRLPTAVLPAPAPALDTPDKHETLNKPGPSFTPLQPSEFVSTSSGMKSPVQPSAPGTAHTPVTMSNGSASRNRSDRDRRDRDRDTVDKDDRHRDRDRRERTNKRKHRSRSRSTERSGSTRKKHHRSKSREKSRGRDRDERKRDKDKDRSSSKHKDKHRSRSRSADRDRARERRKLSMPPLQPDVVCIASRTLWLGRLPPMVSEDQIRLSFEDYGEIERIELVSTRACAYVTLADRRSAAKAIDKMKTSCTVNGKLVKMNWARGKGMNHADFRDLFDQEIGCTLLPYDKLPPDLTELAQEGHIDIESLPANIRDEYTEKGKIQTAADTALQSVTMPPVQGAGLVMPPPPAHGHFPIPFEIELPGAPGFPFPPPFGMPGMPPMGGFMPPPGMHLPPPRPSSDHSNGEAHSFNGMGTPEAARRPPWPMTPGAMPSPGGDFRGAPPPWPRPQWHGAPNEHRPRLPMGHMPPDAGAARPRGFNSYSGAQGTPAPGAHWNGGGAPSETAAAAEPEAAPLTDEQKMLATMGLPVGFGGDEDKRNRPLWHASVNEPAPPGS